MAQFDDAHRKGVSFNNNHLIGLYEPIKKR